MNWVKQRILVGIVVVVAVLVAATGVVLASRGRAIRQPIEFNHRLHVEDVGLDCTDCHRYAKTGARATIPNIEVCVDCHEESQGESAEEVKVVDHIQEGERIPWKKIYWEPDHVYFSHRRHTTIAGLECETCHGDMKDRIEPLARPAVRLTMEFCQDCHREMGAANDCILCHR